MRLKYALNGIVGLVMHATHWIKQDRVILYMQCISRACRGVKWKPVRSKSPLRIANKHMCCLAHNSSLIDLFLFFCRTFSGQSTVPVRGMTGSQTPRRPVAHCESPRQDKSTAGKNPRLTARPAGAVGWPAVGQRRSRRGHR